MARRIASAMVISLIAAFPSQQFNLTKVGFAEVSLAFGDFAGRSPRGLRDRLRLCGGWILPMFAAPFGTQHFGSEQDAGNDLNIATHWRYFRLKGADLREI
ncbi:hypothetical protein UE98_16645 [Burkholderia cenocepacia]|nr:hypothetical protein UE98_16645 [Burkholderia cenocepacia]